MTQGSARISHPTVWRWLREDGYRLRLNRKQLATRQSPDRDAQFQYVAQLRAEFLAQNLPIISKDTKKRELLGNFKNAGAAWGLEPTVVSAYDFPSEAKGLAIPDAVLDVTRGDALVHVGTSRNTPGFAAATVEQWIRKVGVTRYPAARHLLLLVDAGGANSCRSHQWKRAIHHVAVKTSLAITVCHYPTGASKWNPVEHEVLGRISQHWAGVPLRNMDTLRGLIRNTRTRRGHPCTVLTDQRKWTRQVPEYGEPWIIPHPHLPLWNYTVLPIPCVPQMIT